MNNKTTFLRRALADFVRTAAAILGFLLLLLGAARSQNAIVVGGASSSQTGFNVAFAVGQAVSGPAYTPNIFVVQGVVQPYSRTVLVRNPTVPVPEFRVYPNPASEAVFIASDAAQPFGLALYDLEGRAVVAPVEDRFDPLQPYRLETTSLPSGLYLLKIETPLRRAVYKILVAD